ncbi:hypothetical protein P13BB106kb_p008 [Pectobacterium phage DU_PP_V]|uniref:Uncharacterized protein n=1 Tax=Pectobacterium phage DU_PP_V TaxID=2041492 RepID=A0A2D2W6S0_9CAUD|nr:hypothetical protein HOS40_gp008 [Pectobacterium phage DU_PP_V]ATS93992.1 hypothetical protein P13BB106kb_p008 [Pectobacterium phage DU_PP_V]
MSLVKSSIIFSEQYDEYRVSVGKATYYTNDATDAQGTLSHMQQEHNVKPYRVNIKIATERQEENW